MKRVGGGYVMREAPNVPVEPVRPRMTQVGALKKKNEELSHLLAEKSAELDSALAKIRQLEIEGTTVEEDLDILFYYYLKEEEKRKEAEKRLEEVEKSFSHVVQKLYLRTSKVPQMKESLGKMQELSQVTEVEVDEASRYTDEAVESPDVVSVDDYEVAISEESYYSCEEGEDAEQDDDERYWEWPEEPTWPHFAMQEGNSALASGQDDDKNYWEWPEDPTWPHFGIQDGAKALSSQGGCWKEEEQEKEHWTCDKPPGWPHFAIQDGVQVVSSQERYLLEEEEEKDSKCDEPYEWPHYTIQYGMPALYSEELYKYYEDEHKEHWSEDPEWLHCAVQDSGQALFSTQASPTLKKGEEKEIGLLFNLLKGLITPFRMVHKLNQDYKRQSRKYKSRRSWIGLQESLMDGIISSSKKKWTKQDELWIAS